MCSVRSSCLNFYLFLKFSSSENEHYLLWPTLNVPVVVYDEEPSSIIAYTLGYVRYTFIHLLGV